MVFVFRSVTIDGVWIGYWIYWPLNIHHSELHFTHHWHTQTSVLSLLQSPPAVSWQRLYQWRFFSFPCSGPLFTAACAELLSIDSSTNWVPGWRPFHINLLVFCSQADFQLNSLINQLLHVTSLNWNADNSVLTNPLLQSVLLITSRHEPHRKHHFHCYSPLLHRKGFCFFAYCIATAVLVAHFEVSTQQRVYTSQYGRINMLCSSWTS
jgi:hypothetical protein